MSGEQPQVKATVLVVDDDESVRRGLYWALNPDFRVLEASTRSDAIELLQREKIDVVVSDLHLPPHEDGIRKDWLLSRRRAARILRFKPL